MQDPIRCRLTLSRGSGRQARDEGVAVHLAPSQCAAYEVGTQLSGGVVLRSTGAEEVVVDEVRLGKEVVHPSSLRSPGVDLGVAQKMVIHLKNTSAGRTLPAYPLLTIDSNWGVLGDGNVTHRYILGARLIEDTAPVTVFLAPGESVYLEHQLETWEAFDIERWLVHSDAAFGALVVSDLKVGINSQVGMCNAMPAALFSEKESVRMSGDKAQRGVRLAMSLTNVSRHAAYLQAEVEGLAYGKVSLEELVKMSESKSVASGCKGK